MDTFDWNPIISELIIKSLLSMITFIGNQGVKEIKQHFDKNDVFHKAIKESTGSVLESLNITDDQSKKILREYLLSPEIESIIRQIYAASLTESLDSHENSIRSEFRVGLALRLNQPEKKITHFADNLFDLFLDECQRALQVAVSKDYLSLDEARMSLRFKMLYDELNTIQKNTDFLSSNKLDTQSILEFEKTYRNQVASRHKYIVPPHFDSIKKIPIDNLFVPPRFILPFKERDIEDTEINTDDYLSSIYRSVILGNPGGGKSTFALKVVYDLAANYKKRLLLRRQLTPILVILRDYGAEKKTLNCSIIQFIETTSNSKYQVSPPKGSFEYLLLNGRVVVLFDGLDELLDTSYRQEVSGDIESFCQLYPSVPVIVTSREVGYEQAPLESESFLVSRIAPFDENQISQYVHNWFSLDNELLSEERDRKAKLFMKESAIVPDLRSNPLLLALMCNIYKGENYIPKNRPDVYEKCALMLFERWDKSRGIQALLPFEAHIRPTMMYLAHWIYSDETLLGGVTEEKLVFKAKEYLCPKRFENEDEAEKAARDFISFCRGRAWVFTDVGTTANGERLYQFTHRTFLEFFTSAYLVRTNVTSKKILETFLPKISRREWDVVAQLSFQLQSKNIEGASDELLTNLIEHIQNLSPLKNLIRSGNYLSFAVRCLEFLIPSPKVLRSIVASCIDYCIAFGKLVMGRKNQSYVDSINIEEVLPERIIASLLSATAENLPVIRDSIEKIIVDRINNSEETISVLALELGIYIEFPAFLVAEVFSERQIDRDYYKKLAQRILSQYKSLIIELSSKYKSLCIIAFETDLIRIKDIIEFHGIDFLFERERFYIFSRFLAGKPPINILRNRLIGINYLRPEKQSFEALNENLEQITTEIIFNAQTNELIDISSDIIANLRYLQRAAKYEEKEILSFELSRDALFGAFLLIAASFSGNVKYNKRMVEVIKRSKILLFQKMRLAFIGRFEAFPEHDIEIELNNCGFDEKQQEFIWTWLRGEINFPNQQIEPRKRELI
jgi:hypothetical protein